MLISPPFLPPRETNQTEDQWIDAAMPGGEPGNGAYPVSYNLGWHGGLHLEAPPRGNDGVEPVRAIADGVVVYRRGSAEPPAPPEQDAPLNYGGRTSDGVVVIRHETEIGAAATGNTPTRVIYFSVYMHLHTLRSAVQQGRRIYRKDEIGQAGYIAGRPNQIHFEIVCDDANLRQLVGRASGDLETTADGRLDAVYGQIYFALPGGTPFYDRKPLDHLVVAHIQPPKPNSNAPLPPVQALQPVYTSGAGDPLVVGLQYAGGEGADGHRGSAYFTSLRLDGASLGDALEEVDGEYKLNTRATQISDAYPANARPAPSAIYELLRFGRVVNTANETLTPNDVPHWRRVRYPGGQGWVNLNAANVRKFSDADFPHWRGWCLIEDAQDGDSLCNDSTILHALDLNDDDTVTAEEAHSRLNTPEVRALLKRLVCKFPTEWEAETIDARWGWLKTQSPSNPEPMPEADFARLRAHITALAFWQQANLRVPQYDEQGQPAGEQPLPNAHWRLEPREFIRMFRKCGWLSADEMARCFPRKLLHLSGTHFVSTTTTWNSARTRAIEWARPFNQVTRKYGVSASRQRLLHLFSHVIPETGNLRLVKEINGETKSYNPYYGRGLIQLTHLPTYAAYGKFRKFTIGGAPAEYAALGWNPNIIIARNNDGDHNAYNCVDSACFYVVNRANMLSHMDAGVDQEKAIIVSKDVNGYVAIENLNGLEVRLQSVLYLRNALLDDVFSGQTISCTFAWRRNSQQEPVFDAQGHPVMVGSPPHIKKKYYLTQHTISSSLELQTP